MSETEEKRLKKEGKTPADEEWISLGIARHVTWQRTYCSINGINVRGESLEGNYGSEKEVFEKKSEKGHSGCYKKAKMQLYPELAELKKSEGFNSNVKYFKCGWTPRKPEDYLLSNALCLHIKEMIELQNSIEIDGEINVLLLNKDDIKNVILNPEQYKKVNRIWLNQNIILNSDEIKLLNKKGYKFIPREFFGQELREAAE